MTESFSHCGLPNIGNTCYMNSTLQCLSVIDIFNFNNINTPLYNTLKNLFAYMLANKKDVLIGCIKQIQLLIPKFNNYNQQCAHEFLHDLLDCLHEQTKDINSCLISDALPSPQYIKNAQAIASNDKLLMDYHQQHIKNYILFEYYKFCKTIKQSVVTNNISNILCQIIQCKNCNYISPSFQFINIFDITISGNQNHVFDLIDLIANNDINNSVIEQYFCDKCNTHSNSLINKKLIKTSKYIIFSFKRFDNFLRKNNANINCPSVIDISNLFWNFSNNNNKSYEMISNVSHYGTLNGGHYVANCKRDNKWFFYNDDFVSHDMSNIVFNNVYLVFYKNVTNT